jgi:hypothetical protein
VRGFQPVVGGWEALLDPEEVGILRSLATQLSELLGEAAVDSGSSRADAAVDRLLPDAYEDDEEAAAEWRRLSRRGLADRKKSFAARMAADLAGASADPGPTRIRLDEAGVLDWMRAIGDLRLVLAERTGLARGDSEGLLAAQEGVRDLYEWLAWIQDDLVRALEGVE